MYALKKLATKTKLNVLKYSAYPRGSLKDKKVMSSAWQKNRNHDGLDLNSGAPILFLASKYDIYCRGDLLHMVQMSDAFGDSKTFVDKKMKFPAPIIIENYQNFMNSLGVATAEDIINFVDDNFEEANELEPFDPPDWVHHPAILKSINDVRLRNWASELNSIWKHLSRIITSSVLKDPDLYSIIPIPNGFVVPGGRFSEVYYWDTYWIVNGMLFCDMIDTAKGMIENLLFMVNTIGLVPNGGRIYYEKRTQPPLLVQMVESYFKRTHNFNFIAENIDILDKEMEYWLQNRVLTVEKNGIGYTMFRYFANDEGPRPESYREDQHSAVMASSEEGKQEKYTAIKSAAESGWDFSTRWFILNGENKGNLSNMMTQSIVPVDLNAFMHRNFCLLHRWYARLKKDSMAKKYYLLATELLTAIEHVLWDEEEGIWLDYDISNQIQRDYFYMSNFAPLWTKSYTFSPEYVSECVFKYMLKYNLHKYTGGSPTSTEYSGEQWDFPNAWPPLQAFLIQGLDRIGTRDASELAFHFADLYIHSNYKGFKELGVMFEKYDSLLVGRTGDGGEYDAQEGFGWTNGVVFELLHRWGHRLRAFDTKFQPRLKSATYYL